MFYNSYNGYGYNDCTSHGACSVSPNVSSMQEFMFIIIRQTAYFLIKLRDLGKIKPEIVHDLVEVIASVEAIKDYTEAQILDIFSKQYVNLVNARKEYLKVCKEFNCKCDDIKNLVKLSPMTNLSGILKRGDREFLLKYKKFTLTKNYYAEILSGVMKSVCLNLIEIYKFNSEYTAASDEVLNALNIFNRSHVLTEKIKNCTDKLAQCNIELLKLLNDLQKNNYGIAEKNVVSYSTRPNKAIMVSGSGLKDLEVLLKELENEDIDVYTNGNLLIAHTFPYFKNNKKLIGHFGNGVLSTILDFATFPGAILLTQNESQNIEYLYRGRLFSTDKIPPKGVASIANNDFTQLINSAKQAKGFAKGRQREAGVVGFNPEEISEKLDDMLSTNPEKIYIIGFSNLSLKQKEYFSEFFSLMPKNSYAISFSYNPDMKNVLHMNIGRNYPLLYSVLHILFEKIPANSDKLAFFLTKCDISTLSYIISLKNNGAKKVFLSDCPSLVINPAVLRAFNKLYDIHDITTPQNDLKSV